MEVVVSAFAVVSLSLQLLQNVNTIKSFMQGMKHASTEIQKVIQTLEILGSLLDELRDVLELQSLRHAPPPSAAIINCMARCEVHLQPLKDIVEKYSETLNLRGPRVEKLWDRVKVGLKMKDIAAIEKSIHQEISNLNTAISMNNTRIQ